MKQRDIDYAVIKNTVSILGTMCASSENHIIDLLTGYLWDEEEAGKIKRSSGKYEINITRG